MLITLIKYFALIFYSLILYVKILNYKNVTVWKIISTTLFSFFLSFIVYEIRLWSPDVGIVIMVILVSLFIVIITKTQIEMAITVASISLSISYITYLLSNFLAGFFLDIAFMTINDSAMIVISIILQPVLILLPFRLKRFRKGFSFFQKKGAGRLGVLISIIVFLSVLIFNPKSHFYDIRIFALSGILLCLIGIIIWWRNGIKNLYLERQRKKELDDLNQIIADKDEQIKQLQNQNEFSSSLIHRDSKIIPAMEDAVRDFIVKAGTGNIEYLQSAGKTILDMLTSFRKERFHAIKNQQRKNTTLASTGVPIIDSVLRYMREKAFEYDIDLELLITGDIKYLTQHIINEIELSTLIADHTENAIIATKSAESRRILISIGIFENCFELVFEDSGIPFEIDTLRNLGIRKITTYAERGGSGTGFMTTFEILRKYSASLFITEYMSDYRFTKKICIRFNNKNNYNIVSYRSDEINQLNSGVLVSVI